jgi:hypothetical protein
VTLACDWPAIVDGFRNSLRGSVRPDLLLSFLKSSATWLIAAWRTRFSSSRVVNDLRLTHPE